MARYVVGAGLFAVAGVQLVTWFVVPARAQAGGYSQCVVLQTDYVNDPANLNVAKIPVLPAGWTPVAGGGMMQGAIKLGAVLVCK